MPDRPPDHVASPDDFSRARAIFESLVDADLGERERLLGDACADDGELRAMVRRMLDADGAPHALLDAGPVLASDRWTAGEAFLRFRIDALIGRGGMGEVYRARDLSLNRDVALKVLPEDSVNGAGHDLRTARLRDEAHALAALNHPNIATIHELVEADGVRALVLEFVDGETLEERLGKGRMPADEALRYARQIAGALEAAHEVGIAHRDLKPSNVKQRPDSTVKLLDFGLAKIARPIAGGPLTPASMTSDSPGAVMGTAAYMSPEQARGREGDRRSDIWAFGAVLFEMLSGERAFAGGSVKDTIAAVTAGEIPWDRLPARTPASIRLLLARCLDRDPGRRLRDIGEARIVLDDLIDGTATPEITTTAALRFRTLLFAGTVAAAAIGATVIALWPRAPALPLQVTRFALALPADRQLLVDPQSRDLSITRDGSRVIDKGGSRIDRTQLFVHRLDQLEPEPLTPMGLPKGPFVSPDGQWVGYFEPGVPGAAFKKVPLTGGPPVFVSRLDGPSRGATWIDDDTIVVASGARSTGLIRVSPSGGDPVVLTRPDRARGEADHLWPQALPDGRHVLFTIFPLTGGVDAAQVAVCDLASGSWRPILRGAHQAHYLPSGHLVYVAGGALWAIAFDPARAETRGTARVVLPQLVTLPTGVAEFDVADDGTLAYLRGGASGAAQRQLAWVDRDGHEEPIDAPARAYLNVRLSPDGTRVAAEIDGDGHDIWVWDFARKTLTRVTSDPGTDEGPVWMPDGRRLVFKTEAGGVLGAVAVQAADGSGTAERLTEGTLIERPSYALSDGSGIVFWNGTGPRLLRLARDGRRPSVTPLAGAGADGAVSPDEQWMASVALDGDTPQVFVTPFPDASRGRIQVTPAGGSQPRWARDGRSLFFTGLDGTLMSVAIHSKGPITVGPPVRVLTRAYYGGLTVLSRIGAYDVAPDGRRFLMIKELEDATAAARPQVVVVRNWAEELKRLVAGAR
jgi:serine/threonine-protein kinase